MALSDPADVLLAHDRWAMGQMFDACEALTEEQFHREFEMGPGSLHETLTHILRATRGWTDMLSGRESYREIEKEKRSVADLRALHDDIAEEFEAVVRGHPLHEVVSGERGGRSYSFMRGAVMTHVTTHGMHHRAQCVNMLRQIGVEKLPMNSVVEWMIFVDPVG